MHMKMLLHRQNLPYMGFCSSQIRGMLEEYEADYHTGMDTDVHVKPSVMYKITFIALCHLPHRA